MDADAARAFGQIVAFLHRAGRKLVARSYAELIAAVAVANHLLIYTCNPDHFAAIEQLDVIDVPHPGP